MKSPTGLYCVNSQKRTESLLLPSSPTIQADLSANAVFQPLHMRRMYRPFRGQVRSHKTAFLQWLTGCLIRGGLPAMNDDAIFLTDCIAGKPPPTK
ncbi:hypothetical protein EZZ81_19345 [Pseudomonas viridiflava]|uniref:Uncharacterized protein n=1 Tax=Pseudomonas viridiflava TaxID=33069 RepID=A0AA46W039_PSEVI|nr:hypothetical protein EZZ81_19345 [Pseudomonas viridiflava]